MNIALVSMNASPVRSEYDRDPGEQRVLVDGLGRALGALGHLVTIYVRRDDPAPAARRSPATNVTIALIDAGPPEPLPAAALTPWIADFAALLREAWSVDPPETIHAFGWMSGKAAGAARTTNLPVVQTFAALASPEIGREGLAPSEQTVVVRAAARILATSSAQVFALLGLGASPAAIKLVPCGVDLGAFAPAPGSPRDAAQRLRIGTLGDLSERAGVGDVIDALAFVDGVDLVIGGGTYAAADILTDPDAARLAALARARGVADRVEFRGRIAEADMPAFLRGLDIVVCAPREDALGTVALEAMACGVPVIVSAVGGLIDAVADGMTGIHVPPRAPRQLAYAIEALGADRSRRERFGRFGIERATARFGWSRIAAETFEIYRTVAACGQRLRRSPA